MKASNDGRLMSNLWRRSGRRGATPANSPIVSRRPLSGLIDHDQFDRLHGCRSLVLHVALSTIQLTQPPLDGLRRIQQPIEIDPALCDAIQFRRCGEMMSARRVVWSVPMTPSFFSVADLPVDCGASFVRFLSTRLN